MADSRYLSLLVSCLVFWAVIAFGLSSLAADDTFSGRDYGNSMFESEFNVNMTTDSNTELNVYSFFNSPLVSTLIGLFGFRLNVVFSMPPALSYFISILNYVLLVIVAFCLYRLVNPFG